MTCDYAATGEGRCLFVFVCWAKDEQDFKNKFLQSQPNMSYFMQGAKIIEGFDESDALVISVLSSDTIKFIKSQQRTPCSFEIYAATHFNYS